MKSIYVKASKLFAKLRRSNTQMGYKVDPFGTHAEFLKAVLREVKNSSKRDYFIIEIGTGGMSSRILREHLEEDLNANLISIESNPEWENKYRADFSSHSRHKIIGFEKDTSWLKTLVLVSEQLVETDIALTFIDSAPWSSRTLSALHFREKSKYVLIHDCDYFPRENVWGVEKEPILFSPKSATQYGDLVRENLGSRSYDDMFKYWIECFPSTPGYFTGPPTLIASNVNDLKEIELENGAIFFTSASSWGEETSQNL